jgi:hypothetical protein
VVVGRIAPDFIGLGYETAAVAQSNYFSAHNATLIRLYRNLSPHGLARIGGNVSDHVKYVPDGASMARTEKEVTIINQANLVRLGEFMRATGWKVMWGLNLGTGSREEAAAEAVAVNAALGTRLQSFEIGNEVDGLRRFSGEYDAYHAAFLDYKAAIRALLPNAPFSGPDVIGNWNWITNFANAEAGDMKLLTHHYYRGSARDPASTEEKLLGHDDVWDKRLHDLQEFSQARGIAYRINEVNSFFGGGKAGVSDTFGSALWCLDYMFALASYGCEGVNIETDINQLGWISHYSPIVHDPAGHCSARPEYYGMLAFAMAGKGDLLKVAVDSRDESAAEASTLRSAATEDGREPQRKNRSADWQSAVSRIGNPPTLRKLEPANTDGINLSAYATKDDEGFLWITLVNKDLLQDASLEIALPDGYAKAEAFRLKAPSVESKDQVSFAGAMVSANGKWSPKSPEKVAVKRGVARLQVPHASAAVVRLRN